MITMPKDNEKIIYRKPVDNIITKIDESNEKSILLAGDISTGKSLVIDELLKSKTKKEYINCTIDTSEYVIHSDTQVYELYYVCLIVSKMIKYIKDNHIDNYFEFIGLEKLVTFTYNQICFMYITDNYSQKFSMINPYFLENPEYLLEEYLSVASKVLDVNSIRVIIDNFDSIGYSSKRYQTYMYNLLKKYLNFVATISDRTVLDNEERINNLKKTNEIVLVDYSKDVESVKKILETTFTSEMIRLGKGKINTSINFILTDEEIAIMMEKTNGNLFDIIIAMRNLYKNIKSLTKEEYGKYLINFIDTEINKNPLISGRIHHNRVLHIK